MFRNRIEIAQHLAEKGFKIGAEIGVFSGYYSEILLKTIPGLKLYCIDPWEVYPGYRDHKFESSMRKAENETLERVKPFGENAVIIKKYSVDAAKDFADESLDFVYIDGNHEYSHVKEDIEAWTPKVRKGGIVFGDDYYLTRAGNMGVINAIHEYVDAHGYKLETTTWDPFHLMEDNRQPQWMFIKS